MTRLAVVTAVPAMLLLAACGGGQDIAVTNDNNVVLNDALQNHAFTNDDEATNAMATNMSDGGNAVEVNGMMANDTGMSVNAM